MTIEDLSHEILETRTEQLPFVTVYIHHRSDNPYGYHAFGIDMTNYGYVLICQVDVPFTPKPKSERIQDCIADLKIQANKIQVEAFDKSAVIQEQINNLLQLGYTTAED